MKPPFKENAAPSWRGLGKGGIFTRVSDWLFGHDFFISYRWEDGRKYAERLAERLRQERFDCFLDSDGFLKGDDWRRIGDRELRKTNRLILVASPAVHDSDAVARELRVFRRTGRRILAVEFEDSLSTQRYPDSKVLRQLDPHTIRQVEPADALARDPSDELLAEIRRTFKGETTASRRLRAIRVTAFALFALTLGASATAFLAFRQYRKATLALARTDFELAQQYRNQGAYNETFAYLQRSLEGNPSDEDPADTAWALLTSENLRFGKMLCPLPEDRVASVFSPDGAAVLWVTLGGELFRQNISGGTSEGEWLGRLPEWPRLGQGSEQATDAWFEPGTGCLRITNSFDVGQVRQYWTYSIDPESGKIAVEPDETDSRDEDLDGIGPAQVIAQRVVPEATIEKIKSSSDDLIQGDEEWDKHYAIGRIHVVTKAPDARLASIYSKARNFDDLIWKNIEGTAREAAVDLVTRSGRIVQLRGGIIDRAIFIPSYDVLLVKRMTYFGEPVLEWVSLGSVPVASHLMILGENGASGKWLVSNDSRFVILESDARSFLFDLEQNGLPAAGGSETALRDSSAGEIVGAGTIDALATINVDGNPVVRVSGQAGVRGLLASPQSSIRVEASPWDFFGDGDSDVVPSFAPRFKTAESLEGSGVLHEQVGKDFFVVKKGLAGHGVLDGFATPIFYRDSSKRLLAIDDGWSARNPNSRVCLISSSSSAVLNRGRHGTFSRLTNDGKWVATGLIIQDNEENEDDIREFSPVAIWRLRPDERVPPAWLADFLGTLSEVTLDENEKVVPRIPRSDLKPPPTPPAVGVCESWQALAKAYGFCPDQAYE